MFYISVSEYSLKWCHAIQITFDSGPIRSRFKHI